MAREVLYRRSFHCDRDLKSMENMFELDQAVIGRKASADRRMPTADGGFEAPRNSLDVPIGGFLEMRRHSEVRCEEIPIGYELSRSLTTRKRYEELPTIKPLASANADYPKPKTMAKGNLESEQKPRTPSVVARLMGLDPLPHQDDLQSSKHPSSRRLLPQEFFTSQNGPSLTKQASVSAVPSQRDIYIGDCKMEKLSYGELPFRNHPQEKQLQEFKREFTARQAFQGGQLVPRSNMDMHALHEKLLQKEKQCFGVEMLQESEEFLDALDFLHTNKDFFVKVLNDPNSLFAKHLQQRVGPSVVNKDGLRQKGGRLTRSFSESRKDTHASLSFAHDLAELRKKQEISQHKHNDKVQAVCTSRFGRDEEMPVQSHRHTRSVSPPIGTGFDQTMPTRIVVLKPNLGKHANSKLSSPLSPLSRSDVNFKMRVEGKENVKQDTKERLQTRNETGAAKDLTRNPSKDGLKDARDIARQIVKQVKEDMSRRLLKEASHALESTQPTRSSSTGRRLPAQRVRAHGDTSGTSDGEGYCTPSRRTPRDNGKLYSSLPSSPRLSRNDAEDEHKPFGFNGKRGVHAERNSNRAAASAKSSRDASRGDVGTRGFSDSCSKQDGIRDAKSSSGIRAGGSNNIKETEPKGGSPKVLPRSLSAPAAATVENRALECEQKDGTAVQRATYSNKAKSAENSLFKGRLLSLKDSFLLSKKKSSKKQNPLHCSSPLESLELSSPKQLVPEQESTHGVEGEVTCHLLSGYQSQATCTTQGDEGKEAMERCLDDVLSESSLTPNELHQWASTTDLVDSASDTSMEKCEQPSPVSVLETPFQEESPSSVDIRETDSKCHDLRLELSPLDPFLPHRNSRHSSFDSSADESLFPCNCPDLLLESFSVCEIPCPFGREEELTYIRDTLAFAGFTSDGMITAHAFSAEHGLNPSIFGRLEGYYKKRSRRNTLTRGSHMLLDPLSRRLLFDVVDEILALKLGKPAFQPWLRPANQSILHHIYTGKHLLEHIWADLSYHHFVTFESEEESLDDLASKDLVKATWSHSQSDMQMVANELERLICGDLVREIVHEYVRM